MKLYKYTVVALVMAMRLAVVEGMSAPDVDGETRPSSESGKSPASMTTGIDPQFASLQPLQLRKEATRLRCKCDGLSAKLAASGAQFDLDRKDVGCAYDSLVRILERNHQFVVEGGADYCASPDRSLTAVNIPLFAHRSDSASAADSRVKVSPASIEEIKKLLDDKFPSAPHKPAKVFDDMDYFSFDSLVRVSFGVVIGAVATWLVVRKA